MTFAHGVRVSRIDEDRLAAALKAILGNPVKYMGVRYVEMKELLAESRLKTEQKKNAVKKALQRHLSERLTKTINYEEHITNSKLRGFAEATGISKEEFSQIAKSVFVDVLSRNRISRDHWSIALIDTIAFARAYDIYDDPEVHEVIRMQKAVYRDGKFHLGKGNITLTEVKRDEKR